VFEKFADRCGLVLHKGGRNQFLTNNDDCLSRLNPTLSLSLALQEASQRNRPILRISYPVRRL
jgi:hypothetical protein